MMKHSKRFLCLLLTLILAASLCVFPAAAADQTCPSSKDDPVVFVHGLMGWGQRAGINAVLPYWGMTTGSLTSYLNALGYETYSATVGPISSAWDRACELYAQLTGTTVDYGAAHAAAHDHARYGITYDRPLFAGWGTKRAVNLVGHSFGGAPPRQFLELMANGSAEEVAAAKAAGTAPSPLFTGGKRSWVHSMTEIAAPHNGTTFIESNGAIMDAATNLAETLAKGFGITEVYAKFTQPIVTAFFQPGTGALFVILVFFAASFSQTSLSVPTLALTLVMCFLLGTTAPPVPGGMVMLYSVVLTQAGLGTEALAVFMAANFLFDALITGAETFMRPAHALRTALALGEVDRSVLPCARRADGAGASFDDRLKS